MIPVHHQLQPQILVEESRGVPLNVVQERQIVQERQVPVLHQYVVEENVRPVHHQLQQQYVVEENLRNSNFVNEFNRLEGNLESEQQRLLEKDSRIGKCLRWCIFLLPLLFFLICFIFCIVILSLLGQARSVHSIEQSRNVLTDLGRNLQQKPFNDIYALPSEGLSVATKCPQNYETVPLYNFRGVKSGCYCDGKLTNSYRCVGPNIISDCRKIDHQNGVNAYVDAESYLCGRRVSQFRRKEARDSCRAGEKASGLYYCIPANENDLITDAYLHRMEHKLTQGAAPRALAQRKTHRQVNTNVQPQTQPQAQPQAPVTGQSAAADAQLNAMINACFSRSEWVNSLSTRQKNVLCPKINTHKENPSDRAMIGFISTVGRNATHPCLNPSLAPSAGSNIFTESWLRQTSTGCGEEFAFENDKEIKDVYHFSGQSPAEEFWRSNDLEKKIGSAGVNSKVPAGTFVNFYSERHHFLGNGAPGCSTLRPEKFNNLERELTTWQRVITILTSIALALSILGLLLSICYICLKRVRLFRKPIIYAVVYVLAFLVAALLIAQAIYYFVIRDNYSIFRNYRSLGQYVERGCLRKPHMRAAVNFINYIYEVIEKIAPFIIFLFTWSIFFILVFLVCWIIGRIKRQAICNRPI